MARPHQTPFFRGLLGHTLRWRAERDYGDPRARVSPMLDDWLDGLHPDLRAGGANVVAQDGVALHSHAAALVSSMAFAFNLFLPFREAPEQLGPWLRDSGLPDFSVERVEFEWFPPGDVLGEVAGPVPASDEKATAIDVVLWGRTGERRVVGLVEVKLAEAGFTPCGGRVSRANRRPDVCASSARFLDDPDACYLRRPWRSARDRRYWTIFREAAGSVAAAHPGLDREAACPFAGNLQQPMRQRALALGLVQADLVDEAVVALVHHDDNPDIPGPWDCYVAAARAERHMVRRPASSLFAFGPPDWAAWMRDRYRLSEGS